MSDDPKAVVPAAGPPRFAVHNDTKIIVATGTGPKWPTGPDDKLPGPMTPSELGKLRDTVVYLQEAIRRMTGFTGDLTVTNGPVHSKGIVLATRQGATAADLADLPNDIVAKLGSLSNYHDHEAF